MPSPAEFFQRNYFSSPQENSVLEKAVKGHSFEKIALASVGFRKNLEFWQQNDEILDEASEIRIKTDLTLA